MHMPRRHSIVNTLTISSHRLRHLLLLPLPRCSRVSSGLCDDSTPGSPTAAHLSGGAPAQIPRLLHSHHRRPTPRFVDDATRSPDPSRHPSCANSGDQGRQAVRVRSRPVLGHSTRRTEAAAAAFGSARLLPTRETLTLQGAEVDGYGVGATHGSHGKDSTMAPIGSIERGMVRGARSSRGWSACRARSCAVRCSTSRLRAGRWRRRY